MPEERRERSQLENGERNNGINIFRLQDLIQTGISELGEYLRSVGLTRITIKNFPCVLAGIREALCNRAKSRYDERITGMMTFDVYSVRCGLNTLYHKIKDALRLRYAIMSKYESSEIPLPIREIILERLRNCEAKYPDCFKYTLRGTMVKITMLTQDAERVRKYASALLVPRSLIVTGALIYAYKTMADDNMKKDIKFYETQFESFMRKREEIWRDIDQSVQRDILYATWKFIKERGAVDFSELTNWAKANDYDTDDVMMALAKLKNEVGCIRQEGLMIIYDESAHEYRLGEL